MCDKGWAIHNYDDGHDYVAEKYFEKKGWTVVKRPALRTEEEVSFYRWALLHFKEEMENKHNEANQGWLFNNYNENQLADEIGRNLIMAQKYVKE